jgi:SAM-dependent methyltransferase
MRGMPGAFEIALNTLDMAAEAGLYPYIIAVATRDFLRPEHFESFMQFVSTTPALEVHLLEPCATGKLAGRTDVRLTSEERSQLLYYQQVFAQDETKPILSTFAHLESAQAFGCGAGLTHLYIDGSGEVCPCNLVPLSFGNVTKAPLATILSGMGQFFKKPRTQCVGQSLTGHVNTDRLPASPEQSVAICEQYLEKSHDLPALVHVQEQMSDSVGKEELRQAYDQIHDTYDQFWLTQAAAPIHLLVDRLALTGRETILDVGCGTGYATALLADRVKHVTAVDLSEGMLQQAQNKLSCPASLSVDFVQADALDYLKKDRTFDLVFSSWVLGYIELKPFFESVRHRLVHQGQLAFVVHKQNSPRRELEIFRELAADDPSVLQRSVHFDFPWDKHQVKRLLGETGFSIKHLWEGVVSFAYPTAQEALEHLLKSGAGTAYYDAVVPERREALEQAFVNKLEARTQDDDSVRVDHEYVACIGLAS